MTSNVHLEHVEELVLTRSVLGAADTVRILRQTAKYLANDPCDIDLSVKWDGAPAVVVGVNDRHEPFVATKSFFNQQPAYYTTISAIKQSTMNVELKHILSTLLDIVIWSDIDLTKRQAYQGDVLFLRRDRAMQITPETVSFQPNVIKYTLPHDSGIIRANIGVAWHTAYTYEGGKIFGRAGTVPPFLVYLQNIWNVDGQSYVDPKKYSTASYRVFEDQLLWAADIIKSIDSSVLSEALHDEVLITQIKKAINSHYRGTDPDRPPPWEVYASAVTAVESFYNAKIQDLMTAKAKYHWADKRERSLSLLCDHKDDWVQVFLFMHITGSVKNGLVYGLNQRSTISCSFKKSNGDMVNTSVEGYVVVDHAGRQIAKLVDRAIFSRANFSADYQKGWG